MSTRNTKPWARPSSRSNGRLPGGTSITTSMRPCAHRSSGTLPWRPPYGPTPEGSSVPWAEREESSSGGGGGNIEMPGCKRATAGRRAAISLVASSIAAGRMHSKQHPLRTTSCHAPCHEQTKTPRWRAGCTETVLCILFLPFRAAGCKRFEEKKKCFLSLIVRSGRKHQLCGSRSPLKRAQIIVLVLVVEQEHDTSICSSLLRFFKSRAS
mmetsp:Transcript_13207/g.27967  ORF Transcript_13207/g.27967 Transcript_13207/m.27967 type:complete len:211 (+) Transcript_13207:1346-1978(+)